MKNKRKIIRMVILINVINLLGNTTVWGNHEKDRLLEIPEYPITEEYITKALKEVELDWYAVMEKSDFENQHVFSVYNQDDRMVLGLISSGNEEKRGLVISTMNRFASQSDENSMTAPIQGYNREKLLALAAILYGGFEDMEWIADDFSEKVSEEILKREHASEPDLKESNFTPYQYEYEWNSSFQEIQYHINVGMMEESDEPDILTLGIYNSGEYIPFTVPMEEGEIFEPAPEIKVTEISETRFIQGYNECKEDSFCYDIHTDKYRFYEVSIKENSFAPDYPFEMFMYLAVNTASDENNIYSAYRFINVNDDYKFAEDTIRHEITMQRGSAGDITMNGWLNIGQLLILDRDDEIIQKKLFKYTTAFEITVAK